MAPRKLTRSYLARATEPKPQLCYPCPVRWNQGPLAAKSWWDLHAFAPRGMLCADATAEHQALRCGMPPRGSSPGLASRRACARHRVLEVALRVEYGQARTMASASSSTRTAPAPLVPSPTPTATAITGERDQLPRRTRGYRHTLERSGRKPTVGGKIVASQEQSLGNC